MTNANTKAEKEPPAQAHLVGATGPCGLSGQLASSREGGRARRGPPETTLAPRRAPRGEGMATARSGPGPAERGWQTDGLLALATVHSEATPSQALFPRALVPGRRPAAPLVTPLFPRRMSTDAVTSAWTAPGVRRAHGPRPPRRCWRHLEPAERTRPGPRRPGSRRKTAPRARAPPRTAARVLPTAPGTCGLSGGLGSLRPRRNPATGPNHRFPRAACGAPRVTLGLASLVPSDS